jgi:hypothetical protein
VAASARGHIIVIIRRVAGKVRNFVLHEACTCGALDQFFVHRAREVLVDADFSRGELREERGVILVNHFITGEVLAAEIDGFVESPFPHGHRLGGDGEHQIEVNVVEPRTAQSVVGLEDHVAAVNASEAIEEIFVEGLHAHGDAVDAEGAPEFCLVEGDGGGIALNGPFGGPEEIEALHGFEDAPPLLEVENRRGAAAEESSGWLQVVGDEFEFSDEGV